MAPFSIRFGNEPGLSPGDVQDLALMAEEAGYEALWMTEGSGRDSVTQLTSVAGKTQRIWLGTGILPIFGRTPLNTAMCAAGAAAVSNGRFMLGLGVGNRSVVETSHGVPYNRPVTRLRETITIVRRLLQGEKVDYKGRVFNVNQASLGEAAPSEKVPIYIAALGPRMLELAGEMADGVLLSWTGPSSVKSAIELVQQAAARAGRDPSQVKIAGYVRTSVATDQEAAHASLRGQIARYTHNTYYRTFFRQSGFEQEMDQAEQALARGDDAGAAAAISPRMEKELGVIGTPAECREMLGEIQSMGLQQLVVAPLPVGDPRECYRETISALGS